MSKGCYMLNANQNVPYELFSKIIKGKKTLLRLRKYIEVLKNNGINSDVKSVLYDLGKQGCTCAYVSNVLIDYFMNNGVFDSYLMKEKLGLDLSIDENNIDLNILMVDIFSSLYNVVELDVHKYECYEFDSLVDASKDLLGETSVSEEDAFIRLFDGGYSIDGISDTGRKIIKSKNVKNNTYVGSYEEIAKELFGVDKLNSKEEFDQLCKGNNITYDEKYPDISAKFSGLTNSSIEFWVNYYLDKKNSDLSFSCDYLTNDFSNIDEFISYINNLRDSGYVIGISSDGMIYDKYLKDEELLRSDNAGHRMMFKYFDENNNIVVESWGKEFILKSEDINSIKFQASMLKDKELINMDEAKKSNNMSIVNKSRK
ncbi:MAG: hypothetical protein E7160_04945 [Firmicutes bacterium]|nr:hypothetical protein [Bacillota bacterium]